MRKIAVFIALILFVSCNKKSEINSEISDIDITFDIERFDLMFNNTSEENLLELKTAYPFLFSKSIPDSIWVARLSDSLQKGLRNEVKNTFSNIKPLQTEIENLFKHLKYFDKTFNTPRVITVISDVDYRTKVKVTDSIVLVGLDTYLGKEHKYYQNIYEYIKQNMEKSQIVSDLATQYAFKYIYQSRPRTFLDEMVYHGKALYFKDKVIPFKTNAEKIGYTEADLVWAQENEQYIWENFVENQLLYDTDSKLVSRFINPAPFSKFGLQLDSESPGEIGKYIGWQIVRAYMENNNISLLDMLKKEPTEIFNNSKFKPRK
ncbi:MAG: gliding motility lipoprotein GldB [Bacteroidia bacterium]|nr:gliding motility lipoprotein GldB [Bacteroidia bacterium]